MSKHEIVKLVIRMSKNQLHEWGTGKFMLKDATLMTLVKLDHHIKMKIYDYRMQKPHFGSSHINLDFFLV
jgi:hypothetical protein